MTARLEDLKPDAQVGGLVGREVVLITTAQMMGKAAQVVYRDGKSTIDAQILFRDQEADLEIVSGRHRWRLKRALSNSIGCPESTTLRSLNAHA
ncbi:MAG: hypothetical protein ACK41W_00230 [Cyanobacteriota bacterium]|jgi:hypothetical protein